jgi:hypothetical protein
MHRNPSGEAALPTCKGSHPQRRARSMRRHFSAISHSEKAEISSGFGLSRECERRRLDDLPQLSLFTKLKLTNCAPILGLAGSAFWCWSGSLVCCAGMGLLEFVVINKRPCGSRRSAPAAPCWRCMARSWPITTVLYIEPVFSGGRAFSQGPIGDNSMQFWNDGFGQNRKPWRCGDSWRQLSAPTTAVTRGLSPRRRA